MQVSRRGVLAGLGGLMAARGPLAARASTARFMPAEWEPHAYCVMSWTAAYDIFSKSEIKAMRHEQAKIAQAIARFESVVMLVSPGDEDDAVRKCGPEVEIVTLDHYDLWTRDTLPTFVNDAGTLLGIGWNFNAWGDKFDGFYETDLDLADRFSVEFDLPIEHADIVCEGGAIEVDGAGLVLTTRSCLLNPNRNPGLSEAEIAEELKARLGATKVVWVDGSYADEVTDGHIDGIAKFLAPGKLAVEVIDDPSDPEYSDFKTNLRQLDGLTDAKGNAVEIIPIYRPRMDLVGPIGDDFAASYVNSYIANGGVVMPDFGDDERDRAAQDIFEKATGRPVVTVRTIQINAGGGGIHCATQQVPVV